MTIDILKQLIEEERFVDALPLLQELLPLNESNPFYFYYSGIVFSHLDSLNDAIFCFERAVKLDASLIGPRKNLALLYHLAKNKNALHALTLVSWVDPADAQISRLLLKHYGDSFLYQKADVVFYTGSPWLELKFSPDSLSQSLGGSETAFVVMARELHQRGQSVICFCNTPERKIYEGVEYVPVEEFFVYAAQHEIPTLVSLRSAHPFGKSVRAVKKILWLQDTRGTAFEEDIQAVDSDITDYFCLSDVHAKSIQGIHRLSPQKFWKTRNGFIESQFSQNPPVREPFSLIYASRPERGLKEALSVFEKLQKKYPVAVLHVCFYSQYSNIKDDPDCVAVLDGLQKPGVIYHGSLSKGDLAHLLQKTQIMLYPNVLNVETSCIAAIECMAAGCVMVTSDRGALPETIEKAGVIVNFNEKLLDNLEIAVDTLWSNPQALSSLSDYAHKRAFEQYAWTQIADEWESYLQL